MTPFDDYERHLWDGRAAAYDRGFSKLSRHTAAPLLDAAGVGPATRLLDVGTGPGVVSARAVARGADVTAVDADPGMADLAGQNVPGLTTQVAILPDLPFEDATFDAVVGNYVINHVGDPHAALLELRRVLRPGGRLALTCWVMPPFGALAVVGEAVARAGVERPDDIPAPPFEVYGQPDTFERLVRDAGFQDTVVDELTWTHDTDPEDWWEHGAKSRVGTNGVIIARQDPATVTRIKTAYDEIIATYTTNGRTTLPAHALLASGTR